MTRAHNAIAVGVDEDGAVWTYSFPSFDDALEFVRAVEDDNTQWHWDVRSTDGDWTVAEAIEFHKQSINH